MRTTKKTSRPVYKEEKPTKTCSKCEKTTVSIEKQYYGTTLTDFFPDGRIPMCKNCCWEAWEEIGLPAFLETLQLMDLPLLDNYFESYEYDYKKYISQVTSILGKGRTFKDSTMFAETQRMKVEQDKIKPVELTEDLLQEAQEYWGFGFEENDYIWLTSEFVKYCPDREKVSASMETIIAEICLTQLDIRKRRVEGKDVDKQIKTLNDLMTSAGIKPTQESGTGNSELDAFTKLVQKLENDRPVRDPHPDWMDVDRIKKMLVAFFLYPWARLWGKQKEIPYHDEAMETLNEYTVKPRNYESGD